ncbi:hypothetical protein L7F22_030143 [Adiantum nelumboides]|nr:hypothetical protein [Adiantum nelumboides]
MLAVMGLLLVVLSICPCFAGGLFFLHAAKALLAVQCQSVLWCSQQANVSGLSVLLRSASTGVMLLPLLPWCHMSCSTAVSTQYLCHCRGSVKRVALGGIVLSDAASFVCWTLSWMLFIRRSSMQDLLLTRFVCKMAHLKAEARWQAVAEPSVKRSKKTQQQTGDVDNHGRLMEVSITISVGGTDVDVGLLSCMLPS